MLEKIKTKENIDYEELSSFFNNYLNDKISDEEMTKVLKAICKYSLTKENIFNLTDIFINSGDILPVNPDFIDKHSTGGVGDKTTLIVLPILASLGIKVSKMSGRGLGYTGGTIDKLESIGVKTNLTKKEFYKMIEKHNMVISSQTENLCPMDKKVYALRDVTGTTNSIALIAISIMSKKIASGAKKILIDVKVGNGALVENLDEATKLSNLMIEIGKKYDREVICMLTRMDNPLGSNIGNKIEVMEVIDILKNNKKNNLYELCTNMCSQMIEMKTGEKKENNIEKVKEVIENKKAYNKFKEYVEDLGGSLEINLTKCNDYKSTKDGYVTQINSKKIGLLSVSLGAGRINKGDKINPDAGIILNKLVGEKVKKEDTLFTMYGKKISIEDSIYKIEDNKKEEESIIIKVIK